MASRVNKARSAVPAAARRILLTTSFGPDLIAMAAGKPKLVIDYKKSIGAAEAWQAIQYAKELGKRTKLLLAAERSTASAREILARNGVAVIDAGGNARVELPGLLVVQDLKDNKEPRRLARLSGKAGVVAQALLLEHRRAWKVNEAATRARVSTALAHRVLARLERLNLLAREGSGPTLVRRLVNPAGLLELWTNEEGQSADRRLRLHRLARTPDELVDSVSRKLDAGGVAHAVTGAAAAHLIAPRISSVPAVEIWVEGDSDLKAISALLQADIAETGHNVLVQQVQGDAPLAFRERHGGAWLANRMRIYADLSHDPRRGREQAEQVRRSVIGF